MTVPNEFDLKQNFPIAGVAELLASRNQKEQQMRFQQQQQLLQGLQMFGAGVNSLVSRRQAMAQALTQADLLMKKPEIMSQLDSQIKPGSTPAQMATPVANVAASPLPVAFGQTASPDASGAPIPNAVAPVMASSIPANLDAMRQKLATAIQGTSGTDFFKSLKPPEMVNNNTYVYDANGKLINVDTTKQPKGSKNEIVRPQVPRSGGAGGGKSQDALEKEYRDILDKNLSNRSGGLGIEDSKVNQAIHLRQAVNKLYDPKTGEYHIPPSMHAELAIGLARLMSPSGVVAQDLVDRLTQKTAREGVSNTLISMGFDPHEVGGTTQSVSRFFVGQIDRQGQTAEQNRQGYTDQLHAFAPTNLDPAIRQRYDKVRLGNSFEDVLAKSPDKQTPSSNNVLSVGGTFHGQEIVGVKLKKKN